MKLNTCPHCFERHDNLGRHIQFECPKLVGRSRWVPPVDPELAEIDAALPEFFAEVEEFLAKNS